MLQPLLVGKLHKQQPEEVQRFLISALGESDALADSGVQQLGSRQDDRGFLIWNLKADQNTSEYLCCFIRSNGEVEFNVWNRIEPDK